MSNTILTKNLELDRGDHRIPIRIGYTTHCPIPASDTTPAEPLVITIIWINPEEVRGSITDDEYETIHQYLYYEAKTNQEEKRSTLNPLI